MDLKSIIKNPNETLSIIHLNDIRIGYFVLGKNEISFLGDEVSESIKQKGKIHTADMCIRATIYEPNMAVLDDFFLSPPGKNKTDCTQLDSAIFFKLFDIILTSIGIKSFELFDMSFKSFKWCKWRLAGIGFFLNSRTFYEKYGFKNETHSSPAAKNKIEELRKTTTLKDLDTTLKSLHSTVIKSKATGVEFSYPPKTHNILTEIEKLITSDDPYKDTLDKMPLEYFIRKYLISICEGNTDIGTSSYEVINNIVDDINLFLKSKGFENFDFMKQYPEVDGEPEPEPEPEIFVYPDEDIVNIYINTNNKEGGKNINRKNRSRKNINRKSINRKSINRKNRSRKNRSRKNINRKSINRKSINRKSINRTSINRKSINRKNINRKNRQKIIY